MVNNEQIKYCSEYRFQVDLLWRLYPRGLMRYWTISSVFTRAALN